MAQIQFKGKPFVQNHHLLVKYHELIPKKNRSLTDKVSLHDNLIIHGDNLIALKALLPLYAGKIKCIYIDPPYNTGNEKWAYNDNVNSPMMQEWLGKVVDREDLTRHDKWLCMMTPRLKLLRELLRDDGVIFVSIDDNEVHHLRMLMDEVFGEKNFLTKIAIQSNPRGRQSERYFASVHEYLLVYAKHYDGCILYGVPLTERQIKEYKFEDQDGRKYRLLGLRQRGAASRREDRPKMFFPIYINDKNGSISLEKTSNHTVKVVPKKSTGEESRWMWSKEKIQENFELLETKFIAKRNEWDVFIRDYLTTEENEERKSKSKTLWVEKSLNYQNGKDELKAIFGESPIEYPKPTSLVNYIAAIAGDLDGIFLDSFAGSGTTAHAVLALNKEDGGNRKFILVECEDYADRITAERVRRIIKGVPNAKDGNLKKGLGGTFSYFEFGKAIELESILSGDGLPTYEELARYIFYTATGEEFNPKAMNEKKNFVGESKNYEVYLFYEPDIEKLKNIALTLDRAGSIGKPGKKKRLVFAPTKYLDQARLDELRIDFAQLPFEIYELAR
ncbi:MAG: site-specific DNA-methyltransferase [Pseudomonadota bacterium]